MLPPELVAQIRLLEIRTDRVVEEITGGAYRSIFKGRGIEFEEVREYTQEDDVRLIDWNVSARMGSAYIKKFVEERELNVMFLVDVSASGSFGSTSRSKRQTAAELAALLAFSAGKNGDRTGLMMFSDRIELFLPPRSGRRHALRMISEMLTFTPQHRGTDIALALTECARVLKKRTIVFLISDLIDNRDFSDELKLLNRRHDVIALKIFDPVERRWPENMPPVELEDAESGETVSFDRAPALLNSELLAGQLKSEAICRKAQVDLVNVENGGDILKPLINFFSRRRHRRNRRF